MYHEEIILPQEVTDYIAACLMLSQNFDDDDYTEYLDYRWIKITGDISYINYVLDYFDRRGW